MAEETLVHILRFTGGGVDRRDGWMGWKLLMFYNLFIISKSHERN